MEIPTTGETLDNIVCFWQPEKAVKAGDELDFRYRLYWSAQPPVSTRWRAFWPPAPGWGLPEGWAPGEHYPDKWARRFAIDFVGGDLKAAAPRGIEPVITLSSGEAKQIEILYVEPFDGYRILSTGIRPPTQPTRWRCVCSCAVREKPSAKHGSISISRRQQINATTLTTGS